jgi:16S rRNA (adenine1518-N6/adenine1519-N6)-dimethyltransferase
MVESVAPHTGERLVEIGPGMGALTLPLLERIGELTVIELDRDLVGPLHELALGKGTLDVYSQDVLGFDFSSLTDASATLRVVGNLPYNISTPLIFHLIKQLYLIKDMHFLLQKEVVERLAARSGSAAFGRLSVMVQYHCKVENLFAVGSGAFKPPPKVESAFVRLVPHVSPPRLAINYTHFTGLVKQAFSQRRKMLRRSLRGLVTELNFSQSGIDSSLRPESLEITDFVNLSNSIVETR